MLPPQPSKLENFLGRLDKRVVYLGLVVVTLIPLIFRWTLPLYVTAPAEKFASTVDALPTDKLVLIGSDWAAGTQSENRPQLLALVRHLIRRDIRFAVFSISDPSSPQLAQTEIERAIKLEGAESRYKYGEKWCNLGYKVSDDPWLRTFTRDLQDGIQNDWHGARLDDLPVTRGAHHWGPDGEISALVDVTSSATTDTWYQFLGPTKVRLLFAVTAVMAPEQYPYLDSGQLSGLLTGMKGAAEYEKLIAAPGSGTPAMGGQSFAHLYILVLIALGNLSLLVGHLHRGRARRAMLSARV